jgi:hypothetical protein
VFGPECPDGQMDGGQTDHEERHGGESLEEGEQRVVDQIRLEGGCRYRGDHTLSEVPGMHNHDREGVSVARLLVKRHTVLGLPKLRSLFHVLGGPKAHVGRL